MARRQVLGDLPATQPDEHKVEVCLSNMEIVDVDLSRTTALGEEAYEFFRNIFAPDSACFTISF